MVFCLVISFDLVNKMEAFLTSSKKSSLRPQNGDAATKDPSSVPAPLMWVEKYRPQTVDELASQDEVVAVLKKCTTGKDLPNFLFYGPPGTGKTSAILALAKQLFGPEIYRQRVLELNASDERGIQVIREKVKAFAQYTASSTTASGNACIPLKIVILDEADCMTSSAQAALRRTMEKESKTTRFCLLCNYVTRIIAPLTSRCAKFRFKPLDADTQMERLKYIAQKEAVNISDDALKCLIEISDGDMRRAVTSLQSVSHYAGKEELTAAIVTEMCGVLPASVAAEFLVACRRQRSDKMEQAVDKIMKHGYAAFDALLKVHDRIILEEEENMDDLAKARVCEKLSVCEKRLLDGADEYLQLLDLGLTMVSAMKG